MNSIRVECCRQLVSCCCFLLKRCCTSRRWKNVYLWVLVFSHLENWKIEILPAVFYKCALNDSHCVYYVFFHLLLCAAFMLIMFILFTVDIIWKHTKSSFFFSFSIYYFFRIKTKDKSHFLYLESFLLFTRASTNDRTLIVFTIFILFCSLFLCTNTLKHCSLSIFRCCLFHFEWNISKASNEWMFYCLIEHCKHWTCIYLSS